MRRRPAACCWRIMRTLCVGCEGTCVCLVSVRACGWTVHTCVQRMCAPMLAQAGLLAARRQQPESESTSAAAAATASTSSLDMDTTTAPRMVVGEQQRLGRKPHALPIAVRMRAQPSWLQAPRCMAPSAHLLGSALLLTWRLRVCVVPPPPRRPFTRTQPADSLWRSLVKSSSWRVFSTATTIILTMTIFHASVSSSPVGGARLLVDGAYVAPRLLWECSCVHAFT